MIRPSLAAAVLISLLPAVALFADPPKASTGKGWQMMKTIPVAGEGRWDFISSDPATHRLYVPRSTHVQVIDEESGQLLADWAGTAGVHGVAIVPDKSLGFCSDGKSDSVAVFDLKTNQKITDVKAGSGPDAIKYDAASDKVLVFNHKGGTITFIPVGDGKNFTPTELQVGGALEEGVVDGAGHAFVNVEDKNEVVEIDTKAGTVMNHWPITGGEGPTGLAIDPEKHQLFAGCGENNVMAVMDAGSGKVLATLPIGQHCDGAGFDPSSGEAFASCGDGTITCVKQSPDGTFAVEQTVKTKSGARTMTVDPKSHKLYLPTADFEPAEAGKRPAMKPGTFQIVVVGQ
jgi:DNA-binding beta-propeller fold protein YncE